MTGGFDELWRGGPRFSQAGDCFRLSTDSVLLASFANTTRARSILDLGSGAGVLTVLLAEKTPQAKLTGIEIQAESAERSRANVAANNMDEQVKILNADLREHRSLFPAESFDLVVSNPPYFPENSGYTAPDQTRATARDERSCTLSDVCAAAKWALRWGGCFCMVHRPERLSEIFCAMSASGIEPKRLRMVSHAAEKAPSLVLVEGKRGGKPGLLIEKPLILTDSTGGDSQEVRAIYHRGEYACKEGENQ